MSLLFHGRVAIVTGAGNGLGKAYALLFGSRGASVVVNDLGGQRDGQGASSRPADDVVQEIRNKGGTAVADYHSVEDGAAIVETALKNFGRIDIVVNNAGILRDKSFARTSDADWDLVHAVHLRGSFQVTRAAFPHMKAQNYGRVIMTSSAAGIYGNFGQANYSAAKLGLHGLSQTVAIEGARYNVHCNTVAPLGGTRLTQDILPPDLYETLRPEYVAPLVAWLCHEDCGDSGGLFEAAGGWYGKYRFERTEGAVCRGSLDELVSPEAVRDKWDKITSFERSLHPSTNEECVGLLASALERIPKSGGMSRRHYSTEGASGPLSAVGIKEDASPFTYTSRDVILYALGVGASTRDADYLRYLYENSENFSAVPTFALIAAQKSVFASSFLTGGSGWSPDLTKLLHGEQYLELHKPLPAGGATLHTANEVVDVLDKRTGASVIVKGTTTDEGGELVATTQFILFIGGEGKFGGRRTNDAVVPLADLPDSPPQASLDYTTSVDQAALYRLSGDLNPLHIDPSFAAMGGFKTPILHGLCSLGIACRSVIQVFCDGDPARFKAIKVRFVKPVLPGQTLRTDMWRQGDRIVFRCIVKESGETCLSGGYVDLHPSATESSPQTKETPASAAPKADAFFSALATRVQAEGEKLVSKVRGVFIWNVKVGSEVASQWTVDLKTPPGSVYQGPPSGVRPDVTLTLEERHLLELVAGTLNPQKAFMSGALKVTGNIMMSQKLKELFDDRSKL